MERLRLLSSYKNDFPLHLFLAKKYIQAKKLVEAENIYKYLLALRDDKATRRQMALFYKKTGDTDKAVTLLKDILLKDPYDFGARNSLYSIFKGKGDTVSFEAIVRDVVAAHPDARSFWGKVHNLRKELCHD
jgi:tetratricopeptide (TPR) repeat protein